MNPNETNRQIANLIRKGTIAELDHAAARCRVTSGELTTNWLPWCAIAAGTTIDWNPPTVGEQVILLAPGGDLADAVVLRGLYSETAEPPSQSEHTHTTKYPDGAVIEYDHEQHKLTATFPEGAHVLLVAPETVEIRTTVLTVIASESVTFDTPNAIVTGDLQVDGAITAGTTINAGGNIESDADVLAGGDVKAGAISLKQHKHLEKGDGQPTGPAQ